MKHLIYITIFLLGSLCFGQIKPNKSKFPKDKIDITKKPKRIIDESVKIIDPTAPIIKVPSQVPVIKILEPTLNGNWTNSNGNMIYVFKGVLDNFYFFAEEKPVNPSWSIMGKAIPGAKNVYRFEYGIISNTGNTGFDDWILYDQLKGSFLNARDNNTWNRYHGIVTRSNSKYTPPAPKATTSVLVANSTLILNGIFTNATRDEMWQLKTVGDKVFLFGETVTGKLLFFGTGTKERVPNTPSESYYLKMVLTSASSHRTAGYTFLFDRKGISYLKSSDCYKPQIAPYTSCPDGLILGKTVRTIRLALFDQNRTANVAENIERNRSHFNYQAPPSYNEDPRLKDDDGDGHLSIASNGDDCDDNDPNKFAGNPEIADFEGHDEDCNPLSIGVMDNDGDGFTDWRVCNKDEKGRIITSGDDCDDNDPSVHPISPEVCDGKDNNCNADIDEGVSHLFFRDEDNDGFGNPNERLGKLACYRPEGFADNNRDCDDSDPKRTTNCN